MIVQLLNGLALGVLLLVLSAGLALIFGLRGVVNFAHGALYMLAAYVSLAISQHTNFWVALAAAPACFVVLGVLLDRYGLRFLAHRDMLDLLLLTFALTYIINDVVQTIWGAQPRSVSAPFGFTGSTQIIGVSYPTYRLFLIVVGLVCGFTLVVWLRVSRIGLYVRAACVNRTVAGVVGVDIDRVSAIVVGLGTGLAGLAGALAGPYLSLTISMGADIVVLTFIVVVVGGLGSIGGPMIIALVLGTLSTGGSAFFPELAPYLPYLLMLVVLLFRPLGLAGRHTL